MKIRIGSRGSALALWQAHHIRDRLLALAPQRDGLPPVTDVEIVVIRTTGDRIQHIPLAEVGGKGLFTKELEDALCAGAIDLAVHSMKDMPAELPPGLALVSVPSREDPRDALVLPADAPPGASGLDALPSGATVGTSSLRRSALLRLARPDLNIVALRGNVDTRLAKVDAREGGLDAIVLACAGLRRLGLGHRISTALPPEVMLPAVGQGALAIEAVADRYDVKAVTDLLDDPQTRWATVAERAFLATLEGNCQVPLAAHATVNGDRLSIEGLVASPDGARAHRDCVEGPREDAEALGVLLAGRLLGAGADEILRELSDP
jgi:hydroxymethylbilane synthase